MFRWIGIGLAIVAALIIAFIIWLALASDPVREATRDVFIIILASLMMVVAILLIAAVIVILYAVYHIDRLARTSVIPKIDVATVKLNEILDNTRVIAENARGTTSTVSSTTVFVAEQVATPIIRVSSLMAGVRAAATALARREVPPEPPAPDHG